MVKLIPSLLSANKNKLKEELTLFEKMGINQFHIDMMDGIYVSRIAFDPKEIKQIREMTDGILDVHIMCQNVNQAITQLISIGVDHISIHVDIDENIEKLLARIDDSGLRSGLVINNANDRIKMIPFLDKIQMIQLMSVIPGVQGASFLPEVYDNAIKTKKSINLINPKIELKVDGSINLENMSALIEDGVDSFIVGTSLFQGNLENNIVQFQTYMTEVGK